MNLSIQEAANSFRQSLETNKVPVFSIGVADGQIVVTLEKDILVKPNYYDEFPIVWDVLNKLEVK